MNDHHLTLPEKWAWAGNLLAWMIGNASPLQALVLVATLVYTGLGIWLRWRRKDPE